MAKILLVTLVFSPDGVSTSVLMTELALELKKMGHDICVLTTTPHYNEDPEAIKSQPLRSRWGKLLYTSNCKGIPVFHAQVPAKTSRIGARFLDYMRFHTISTIAGLMLVKNYDLVFAPSPPLTIGLSAWILGLARQVPFIYNVQEIFPDVAVKLGILRNRGIIWLMEMLERFIYSQSRVVIVISEWFRRRLLGKGVSSLKLRVIHNFVDTDFMQPMDRYNAFSKAHGLDHKFTVLYAGNIGLTQNFENLLAAARRLTHLPDLCLLIVGDGARRTWLEDRVKQQIIHNIKILPYQPRSVVPQIYASSDICLVPLKKGTAQETFPSKIYTIMAAGRPAIAAADEDSELFWVVQKSGCGWAIPPDDDQSLAEAIEHSYNNRLDIAKKGQYGRRYVLKHHSRHAVVMQYDKLIRHLLNSH